MRRVIFKVVFVMAVFLISAGLYSLWNNPYCLAKLPASLQRTKTSKWERQIQNHIASKTGSVYFKNNFELLESKYVPGGVYGPVFVNEHQYQKYKFLPLSGKYNYEIEMNYNTDNREVSGDLPPCALEKSADKCSFPIGFSQAYDMAIEKLGNSGIKVVLVSVDGKYKWVATKTEGDPLCGAEYTSFTIDPFNASQSQIQKRKSNFCV